MENQQDAALQRILRWVNQVLAEKGWSEREWSIKATGSPDTVRNITRGRSQAPKIETIRALAKAAGVPLPSIWGEVPIPRAEEPPEGQPFAPMAVSGVDLRTMPQNLPVLGSAACGPDGLFEMQGEILEYVRRPPRLMGVKDAYALYIHGDSMSPWRENGEMVMVHPKRPVNVGDYVVVQLRPEKEAESTPPAYIKRLARRTAENLLLKQFNPPSEIRLPTQRILALHRVMPWSELLGF